MALKVNGAGEVLTQWGGWIGLAGLVVTWIANKQRAQVEESTLVLGKWKELVENHQSDIKTLKADFAAYKASAEAEIRDLRERLSIAEATIRQLQDENAGLKRAIAQNSQSTASMLGEVPGTPAGDNLRAFRTARSRKDDT